MDRTSLDTDKVAFSFNPMLIIACGNIIADYCCITEMIKPSWEVVNVRDENGKSTYYRNTEENIDRVLSTISYESMQKEYFNNPMDGGKVFKNLVDKSPFHLETLRLCRHLCRPCHQQQRK